MLFYCFRNFLRSMACFKACFSALCSFTVLIVVLLRIIGFKACFSALCSFTLRLLLSFHQCIVSKLVLVHYALLLFDILTYFIGRDSFKACFSALCSFTRISYNMCMKCSFKACFSALCSFT